MLSPNQQALLSEEDIRTRVVATWLADHGFTAENISVEFSFELRLGRNVYRVGEESPHSPTFRPRADVLVRSCDGRNLLIIEVKAPNETLDENAKAQGISYARLLKSGGIAPFVVITNGHETQIYDSITEEAMQDAYIPTNHPHAQNRFRVSVDDIALRAEALETFVSLSSDNLLAFCRAQVTQRMRLLRSNDLFSGKKYIPSLYIERQDAKERLNNYLHNKKCPVIFLVGAPQVGKTNFVCHSVEKMLDKDQPCLFYPAISMEESLLSEIRQDFGWIFHSESTPSQVISKLVRILQKTNQKLSIFIDGWNEASQNLVRAIDRSCERLCHAEIQIIISFTNIAAERLLLDDAGNPSYLAESVYLRTGEVQLLKINPQKLKKAIIVEIERYDSQELEQAYKLYSELYNVVVPSSHRKSTDPFLIRNSMEIYSNKELPDQLDESYLIERNILSKIARAVDLTKDVGIELLSALGKELVTYDSPIPQSLIKQTWGIPIGQELPKGLFEAALLAKSYTNSNLPSLDFYYERERCFVIVSWVHCWTEDLPKNVSRFCSYVKDKKLNSVDIGAVEWFLKQPQNLRFLKELSQEFESQNNPEIKKLILSSIRSQFTFLNLEDEDDDDWVMPVVKKGTSDGDVLVRVEAVRIIAEMAEDTDWLSSLLSEEDELEKLVIDLFTSGNDYSLKPGNPGQLILDAFNRLYYLASHSAEEMNSLFTRLLKHESSKVRRGVAEIFGYSCPRDFLSTLTLEIGLYSVGIEIAKAYIDGIYLAINSLDDEYFGTGEMCDRGSFEYLSEHPEEHIEDHKEMYKICMPVIQFYWQHKQYACSQALLNFLNKIAPILE